MMKTNPIFCLIALTFLALPANADKVINTDLIVGGSGTCVGTNCSSAESFGTVSLRLKEVNTRINFIDKSTAAGYPNYDWKLEANDKKRYGANYFALNDITSNTQPFKIMGGALSNSFYIDQHGKVGMGTSTPVADLHLNTGLSPYLTFEQSGAHAGHPSASWKLVANDGVLSLTNNLTAGRASFSLEASSPNDVLVVASNGDVGLGTRTPNASLNIYGENAMMTVNNNDTQSGLEYVMTLESASNTDTYFSLVDGNTESHIGVDYNGRLFFANMAGMGEAFSMDTSGNAYVQGTFLSASSSQLKKGIKLVDKQLILEKVRQLEVGEIENSLGDQGKRLSLSSQQVSELLGHTEDQQHGETDISGLVLAGVQALVEKMDDTSKLLSSLETDADNMLAARNENEIENLLAEIEGLEGNH